MTPDAQARLMDNIVEVMDGVPEAIVRRQAGHFYKADPAYGLGVAKRMGIAIADPNTLAAE
jgi:catalase